MAQSVNSHLIASLGHMNLAAVSHSTLTLHLSSVLGVYFAFHFTSLDSEFINLCTAREVVQAEMNSCSAELSRGSEQEL